MPQLQFVDFPGIAFPFILHPSLRGLPEPVFSIP